MYPSLVLVSMYLISSVFSLYNWDIWELNNFSEEAFLIILSSVILFCVVGLIVEKFFKNKKYITNNCINPPIINVKNSVLFINCLICFVTICWYFIEVQRIAGASGDWLMTMANYRARTSWGILDVEEDIPIFLKQLSKYVIVQGYIFSYIIINNKLLKIYRFQDKLLYIPIMLMIAQVLINAGRLELLKFVAYNLSVYYILCHRFYGWKKNLSFRFIKKAIIIFICTLIGFCILRTIVGRNDDLDPMYYISLYAGGSIKLFDLYIQQPVMQSTIVGKETFYNINQFISKFGYNDLSYIKHLEFRYINGVNIGNVYGALRRYYQDFGAFGNYFLVALFSGIIHIVYNKVKYSKVKGIDFLSIFYSYIFCSVCLFPIDDIFYSSIISTTYLTNVIIMYVLYRLILKNYRRVL